MKGTCVDKAASNQVAGRPRDIHALSDGRVLDCDLLVMAVGMLPLTGTSNAEHMKQDLAGRTLTLTPEEVQAIESLAG